MKRESFKKLQNLHKQLADLEQEIKAESDIYVSENRTLEDGDVVEIRIPNSDNHLMGKGVVVRAFMKYSTRPFELEYMLQEGNEKRFEKETTEIFYEVVQMKKDGKPSSKHFGFGRNFKTTFRPGYDDEVIVKV